ncbi:MAG: hypothetical protein V4719_01725 [Planctomycetota bacterium]
MISIDLNRGNLILGRCEYLYRDGVRNEVDNREMGDGDILIPLPEYFLDPQYRDVKRSDGYGAEVIVEEIRKRLPAYYAEPINDEWLQSLGWEPTYDGEFRIVLDNDAVLWIDGEFDAWLNGIRMTWNMTRGELLGLLQGLRIKLTPPAEG